MPSPQPPMGGKQLLLDKNAKLSAQVAAQRHEINGLKDRLETLLDDKNKLQEATACVSTVWEELNLAIGFLQFKVANGSHAGASIEDVGPCPTSELLKDANPFLARLLQTHLLDGDPMAADAASTLAENLSSTEKALRQKMKDTMEAAAAVLNAVENLRENSEKPVPGFEESKLMALVQLLKAENNKLVQDSVQDAVSIKALESAVADKEAEILTLQRKIHMPRTESPNPNEAGEEQNQDTRRQQPEAPSQDMTKLSSEIAARTKEVELRDKKIAQLESEIYSIKRQIAAESATMKLNVAERQEKLDVVSKELERVQQKLRDAYREQDRLNSKVREVSRDLDRGSRAMKRESRLDGALMKLEADAKRLRSERNEAEDRVRHLQSMQPSETTQELLDQMKGMESEIKMLKSSISSHQKMAENIVEIENFKSSCGADISEYKARLSEMQRLLDSATDRLNLWIERHVEHLKLNEELRWLLEISHGCLDVNKKLEKDVCDAIQKFLKSELPGLEDRIRQSSDHVASKRENDLIKRMTELQQQLEGAKGRQASIAADLEKSQHENAALREEAEVFWKEMDSVSDAYESSREQNARLLLAMSKRDEDNARLLSEAAAAARDKAMMEEERDQAKGRVLILEKDLQELTQTVSALEDRLEKASKERDGYKMDALHLKEKTENLSTETKALGISMDSLRSELAATKKEIATVEEDKAKHLAALKVEKTRAERAEAILSGKKDAKLQAGEAAEREALRKMVNCNVCSTRLKDRIITKCSHLFCSTCIDANLSSRHRKCPGCGERFGAGDVKPFYFT